MARNLLNAQFVFEAVFKLAFKRWMVLLGALSFGCGGEVASEACSTNDPGKHLQASGQACVPSQQLEINDDPADPRFGQVNCRVVLLMHRDGAQCSCDQPGLRDPSPELVELGVRESYIAGMCENECCESFCYCELEQFTGSRLHECQTNRYFEGQARDGFCYVDPSQGFGLERVAACQRGSRRLRMITEGLIGYGLHVVACSQ